MVTKKKKIACNDPVWMYDDKTSMVTCKKCGQSYSCDALLQLSEMLHNLFERMTEMANLT